MKKFIRSFYYAWHGIKYSFIYEQNFRFHFFSAIIVTAAAAILRCSNGEWLIVLICIGMMLSLEMLNTALEKFCDLYTNETHPQIKTIKDVSAGAVLVAAIVSAICGAIIFVPKILSFF